MSRRKKQVDALYYRPVRSGRAAILNTARFTVFRTWVGSIRDYEPALAGKERLKRADKINSIVPLAAGPRQCSINARGKPRSLAGEPGTAGGTMQHDNRTTGSRARCEGLPRVKNGVASVREGVMVCWLLTTGRACIKGGA